MSDGHRDAIAENMRLLRKQGAMNTPSEWAMKEAERIVSVDHEYAFASVDDPPGRYLLDFGDKHQRISTFVHKLHTAIALALDSARRAPEGHIIDDKGEVRKVLGTLPVTADGCVVGLGCTIWNARMTGMDGRVGVPHKVSDHTLWGDAESGKSPCAGAVMWPQAGRPGAWFSSREAAEKARNP